MGTFLPEAQKIAPSAAEFHEPDPLTPDSLQPNVVASSGPSVCLGIS